MKYLPSEQEEKKEELLTQLEEQGEALLREPCDCGARIQHNNGGNYHELIYIKSDSDRYFIKFDTTCTLTSSTDWKEVTLEDIKHTIEEKLENW